MKPRLVISPNGALLLVTAFYQDEISFRLPEIFWDKSKARSRRFQNSPASQTVGIADLPCRLDLLSKNFLMAAQRDFILNVMRFCCDCFN
jgi:hypothetical protein